MNDEFDKFFNEPESYGLRSERFYHLLNIEPEKFQLVVKWMRYTFQAGVETGYKKALNEFNQTTQ